MMVDKSKPANLPFPDERHSVRQIVNLPATARELGGPPLSATVTNLSATGCELSGCSLEARAEIWVQIRGYQAARATVMWSRRNRAGCLFYSPLVADIGRGATVPRRTFGSAPPQGV